MRSLSASTWAAAYATDLVLGDPRGMPHPVRWIGSFISLAERKLRPGYSPVSDFIRGTLLSVTTVIFSFGASSLGLRMARSIHPKLADLGEIILAWTALATGSLLSETEAVVRALESGQLPEARRLLSGIVGRDTGELDESGMARAVIETLAESLCDGVVAPMVFLSVGGVPAAWAYKAVNTLDSMIGHPEPPYTYFGRFAARLDDAANFLPARLTALAIVASAVLANEDYRAAWRTWREEGYDHPSPNAGQSEAAMAGALCVRLGGLNHYQGKPSPKPFLGKQNPEPDVTDAGRALKLARITSAVAFAVAVAWCTWRRKK